MRQKPVCVAAGGGLGFMWWLLRFWAGDHSTVTPGSDPWAAASWCCQACRGVAYHMLLCL